jgi:hypothetical protein
MNGNLVSKQKAYKSVRTLRKLNIFVLCVAVVVYVGLLVVAFSQDVAPLAVFSSCIMLAEVLVFQIVRTLSDYVESQCQ